MNEPQAVTHVVRWYVQRCGGCGLWWAVDTEWDDERRRDGVVFNCPNGCRRVYRETEADRQRRRAESAERSLRFQRERAEAHARSLAATKGHLTRLRNKMARGQCPCCDSNFRNVRRHMVRKHPEFLEEKGL